MTNEISAAHCNLCLTRFGKQLVLLQTSQYYLQMLCVLSRVSRVDNQIIQEHNKEFVYHIGEQIIDHRLELRRGVGHTERTD